MTLPVAGILTVLPLCITVIVGVRLALPGVSEAVADAAGTVAAVAIAHCRGRPSSWC